MSSDPSPNLLDVISQGQALSHLAVATLSLLAYDIVLGLFEDIRILSTRSPKLPDVIYILSRTFAICLATANCIFSTSAKNLCIQGQILTAVGVFSAVLVPCNSWLFLLRVRAIPPQFRSQTTLTICTILWLSTFSSFLIVLGIRRSNSSSRGGKCKLTTDAYSHWLILTQYIALVVFDTVTMMAILIGFAMHSPDSSWITRVKSTISTKQMGHISGVFVRSGLIYYLATIGIHLSLPVLLPFAIPTPIMGELSVLTGVFHNIMTCRVFRLLKLEALDQPGTTSSLPTDCLFETEIVFRNTSNASL